jgi:endonuclease YncB( thermonuclease family)
MATTTASPASAEPFPGACQMVRGASKPMRLTLHHIAGAAIAAAVAMPLLVSSPTARAQPVDTTASVLKVVDGDTIDIRDDVRGRLRVRMLGIDSPETKILESLSAAGDRKRHSSPTPPCSDSELLS